MQLEALVLEPLGFFQACAVRPRPLRTDSLVLARTENVHKIRDQLTRTSSYDYLGYTITAQNLPRFPLDNGLYRSALLRSLGNIGHDSVTS